MCNSYQDSTNTKIIKKKAEFLYQLQHVRQKWKPPSTDTLCLLHILTTVPQSSIIGDYVGLRVTSEILIGIFLYKKR